MDDMQRKREIDEAIEAGRYALKKLDYAADKLGSAKGWGIYDMLGGGFFSSLIKHNHIDEAREALDDARQAIHRFAEEADDVRDLISIDVNIDQWNATFDIWFDNIFADIAVQSQLSDAADKVDEARDRIKAALRRLEALR